MNKDIKYQKNCPECGRIQEYKEKEYLLKAIRKNVICKDCSYKNRKKDIEIYQKNCPCCNKIQIYTRKYQLLEAIKDNTYCKECDWGKRLNIPIKEIIKINNIKKLKKNCPICGKEQIYKKKNNFLKALRDNRICQECAFKKKRISPEEKKRRNKICGKKYRLKNKEKLCIKDKINRQKPKQKEYNKKYQKEYRQKNKEKLKNYLKLYNQRPEQRIKQKKKRKTPIMKIRRNMSDSIRYILKTNNLSKNKRKWETLVRYTLQDLKEHLEKLFKPGMNWNNYGKNGWVIDHIIPIVFFQFKNTNDVEFLYCWSLNNLQPLWAKDNLEKSDFITLWGKKIRAREITH